MIKVRKENKVYQVSEAEEASRLAQGYDVIDNSGNVVKHSTNAVVPRSDYVRLKDELEKIKKENEELKKEQQDKEVADTSETGRKTKAAKDKAEEV